MMNRKRTKPDVLIVKSLPDGSTEKNTKPWDEAAGQLGPDGQIFLEHSFLHSNVISKESDRAAAILAPAYLDVILEELLRSVFVKGKSSDSLLKDQGPIGTFSARIDTARSLDLIPEDTWHDLHLLRKVRNDFAHCVDVHSFAYESVRNRCKEFRVPLRYKPSPQITEVRERFLFVVWAIVGDIAGAIKRENDKAMTS